MPEVEAIGQPSRWLPRAQSETSSCSTAPMEPAPPAAASSDRFVRRSTVSVSADDRCSQSAEDGSHSPTCRTAFIDVGDVSRDGWAPGIRNFADLCRLGVEGKQRESDCKAVPTLTDLAGQGWSESSQHSAAAVANIYVSVRSLVSEGARRSGNFSGMFSSLESLVVDDVGSEGFQKDALSDLGAGVRPISPDCESDDSWESSDADHPTTTMCSTDYTVGHTATVGDVVLCSESSRTPRSESTWKRGGRMSYQEPMSPSPFLYPPHAQNLQPQPPDGGRGDQHVVHLSDMANSASAAVLEVDGFINNCSPAD